jgi:capsular polysaccharide biosynthesis protein
VNDPDQTITFSSIQKTDSSYPQKSDGLDDAWTEDEVTTDEENPTVDRTAAFVSLAFITAALKRSAWFLCATAIFGLIIGYALYAKFPPSYSAKTSVLLSGTTNSDPTQQLNTNVALAQSQAVAQRALNQLGSQQSVSSFIAAYTVTAPSDQVLVFQVNAASPDAAVQRASAVAAAFLHFRADYLEGQQQLAVAAAQQQVTQAEQKVSSINQQISAQSAQLVTSDQQAKLKKLQAQLSTANTTLISAQQNADIAVTTGGQTTQAMVKGSQVLNTPAPVPHSFKQKQVFYLVLALIAGLAIGAAIVVARALVSDRLRNRDDIADAIGAPVTFSTAEAAANWLPPAARRAGLRAIDVKRLANHLDGAVVPPRARRFAALAVVAVDNTPEIIPAVLALAESWASEGKSVVLADLSDGAPAARKLGVKHPGVRTVSAHGVNLTVTVPGRDEPAPVGPLPTPTRHQFGHVHPDLAAACATADYLLTLVTLDPVAGGDHLATWATEAVAVVTAGRSSSVRIHAVGEIIRLAGVRLASVVLLKADKSDESLGALGGSRQPALASPL